MHSIQPEPGATTHHLPTTAPDESPNAGSGLIPSVIRRFVEILGVTALYVITGKIGFLLAIPPGNITVIWPSSGIALAAILLLGYRVWPGIWLGSFCVNLWFFAEVMPLSAVALATSDVIALGSTIQALLGAWLIRRIIGHDPFERVRAIFQFVGIETAVCLFASTIGVTSMALAGFSLWADYGRSWWTWWLGDLIGIIVVTPCFLVLYRWSRLRDVLGRPLEAGLLISLVLAVAYVIFGGTFLPVATRAPLTFAFIPLIAWATLRFGLPGVVFLVLVVSSISIWGTTHGHGPFMMETLNESLALLQAFVGVVTMTGLVLAAAVTERKRAEEELRESEIRNRVILDAALDCVVTMDHHGRIIEFNPAAEKTFGYARADVIGKPMAELLIPPALRDSHHQGFHRHLATGQSAILNKRIELNAMRADGTEFPVELTVTRIPIEGRPIFTGFLRDITERKESEHVLQRYAERLKILHEIDRAILSAQSPAGIAQAALRHLKQLVGCYRASIVLFDFKTHEGEILALDVQGDSKVKAGARLPVESFDFGNIQRLWQGEVHLVEDAQALVHPPPVIEILRREGLRSYLSVPLMYQGQLIGTLSLGSNSPGLFRVEYVEIAREVADLLAVAIQQAHLVEQVQRHAGQMEFQAMCDPLTGVPNRLLLYDRLQQAILAGQREGRSLALLMLDLDRFKEINDQHGHQCGDLVLKQLGPRLRTALRESDTLARLGGDEFGVLLPNTDAEGAARVARKINSALAQPFLIVGRSLEVRASIGSALFPEHGIDPDALLRHADVAMYHAKQSQTGYASYTPEQDPCSPSRLALIDELRDMTDGDQLTLLYQPTVELRSGRVLGIEALARWHHPGQGVMLPDQFLPVAEQIGLLKTLVMRLLTMATRRCVAWHRTGQEVPVSMNLPAQNLHDRQFPDRLAELLDGVEMAPSWLELEVTEHDVMKEPDRAIEVVTRLSGMGIRFCIDDFGIGHSSLGLLQRLPVKIVKIDTSKIAGMANKPADAVMVRSIIDLAHNLELQVVAEGVEHQAIWDQLVAFGCDAAQGYYISQPMPGDELTQWLAGAPSSRSRNIKNK